MFWLLTSQVLVKYEINSVDTNVELNTLFYGKKDQQIDKTQEAGNEDFSLVDSAATW